MLHNSVLYQNIFCNYLFCSILCAVFNFFRYVCFVELYKSWTPSNCCQPLKWLITHTALVNYISGSPDSNNIMYVAYHQVGGKQLEQWFSSHEHYKTRLYLQKYQHGFYIQTILWPCLGTTPVSFVWAADSIKITDKDSTSSQLHS